jgi:hypothetical protein
MTKSRRTGKALAELVIGVIFLQRSHIGYIYQWGDPGMLEDFRYACLNFESNRDQQED